MRSTRRLGIGLLSAWLVAAGAVTSSGQTTPAGGAAPPAEDPQTVVLSLQGNWRAFYVLSGPFVRDGDKLEQRSPEVDTPPPPDNWRETDFDDHTWHRLRGMPCQPHVYGGACAKANAGFAYLDGSSAFQSLICLRGRFSVTDPAQVKDLILTVEYRGGVVVWLNGREVARGHMPPGEVKADTLAEDYPLDTFLDPDGKLQKEDWRTKDPEVIRCWKRIRRTITEVKVPARMLRKGVNVLAVEVHRSAYSKGFDDEISKWKDYTARPCVRSTCGMTDLVLKSPDGEGVLANVVRPEGMQVWNSSVLVEDPYDFGDPLEPLRSVTIPACRNGAFSGEVSVGSRSPITKLKTTTTDLVDVKTGAVIPASSVLIRCDGNGTPPEEVKVTRRSEFRSWEYTDAPAEIPGAVQPITITVKVPKEARPGAYAGKLTLTAEDGGPFVVPVEVSVSSFTLGDPRDYETVVDMIQSPDTLDLEYEVEPWSDEHWKLIDRSFSVLGTIGLDTIYIPLIAETHFGNEQSMVRWIRKADGTYDYDFSVLEKYLDAYERHCGKPRIVCLYVWDVCLEGGIEWVNRTMGTMTPEVMKLREEHAKLALGPVVSLLNPATGKTERLQLPQYSENGSLELWKPLCDGLRGILERRGILDKVMLGIPLDPKPTKEVVDLFRTLMPGTPWLVQDHIYRTGEDIHGVPVVYQANVFLHGVVMRDIHESRYGTQRPELRLRFPRDLTASNPMHRFRLFVELHTFLGFNGFARVGGDLWPVMKDKRGRKHMLPNRYPKSNAGGLSVWTYLLEPGVDGARATPGFQMLCEGLQETEARIVVERALLEERITGDLARRCRDLLTRRNLAVLIGLVGKINEPYHLQWWEHTANYSFPSGVRSGRLWYLASDHETRTKELFDLAAEVDALIHRR